MIEKLWVGFAGITEPCSSTDTQTSEHLMAYQYIKNTLTAVLLLQNGSITFLPSPEITCLSCLTDL